MARLNQTTRVRNDRNRFRHHITAGTLEQLTEKARMEAIHNSHLTALTVEAHAGGYRAYSEAGRTAGESIGEIVFERTLVPFTVKARLELR